MAIPGLHAITACDITASFLRKGEVKPHDIVGPSKEFQDNFFQIQDRFMGCKRAFEIFWEISLRSP